MKIVLILSILFSCSLQNKMEGYLNNFQSLDFPLTVDRSNLFDFNKVVYDEKTDIHTKNIYPSLDKNYYEYINQDKSNKIDDYRCLYKFDISKESSAVIIIEDYKDDNDLEGLWFKLYTYDNQGKIIDNILLGGYHVDYLEHFFDINANLDIVTTRFEFLPPPDGDYDNMYAKKTIVKYTISDSGRVIKKEENEKMSKFTITDNGYKEM